MVGFGENDDRFITVYNLTSIDNFGDMLPDEVKQIIKMYNERQVGNAAVREVQFVVQKNLKGLLEAAADCRSVI